MQESKIIYLIRNSMNDRIKKENLLDNILEILYNTKSVSNDTKSVLDYFKNFKSITFLKENYKNGTFTLLDETVKDNFNYPINTLKSELLAFIIHLSQTKEHYEMHKLIIYSLGKEILQKYYPGIMSFNLSLLSKTSHSIENQDIISVINFLLCRNIEISKLGKQILYDSLVCIDREILTETSWICKNIFENDKRIFFLQNLILTKITLSEREYDLIIEDINIKIRDIISSNCYNNECIFKIIYMMSKSKVLKISDDLWINLKKLYRRNNKLDYVIETIQANYEVESPIWELMPINEQSIAEILKCNEADKIKIALRRIEKPLLEFDILKLYLGNVELQLEIRNIYDINKIAADFNTEMTEFVYIELDKLVKRGKKSLIVNGILPVNKPDIKFEQEVDEILEKCLTLIELYKNTDLNLIVELCLKFLDKLNTEPVALKVFKLIRGVQETSNEGLIYTFDKVLYFDLDSSRIRAIKYDIIENIFNKILENPTFVTSKNNKIVNPINDKTKIDNTAKEKTVDGIANKRNNTVNDKINKSFTDKINNTGMIIERKENSFFLPMLVRLWDELSIIPDEIELKSVLKLLKTSINKSGAFYQKRLLDSDIYKFLLNRFTRCKYKIEDLDEFLLFIELMDSIIKNFLISKSHFEEIYFNLCQLHEIIQSRDLIFYMTLYDPYFCFYTIFIQERIKNLNPEFKKEILKITKLKCQN